MKKIICLLSIGILFLYSNQLLGQTPYLQEVTVNNASIPNCSTIAFGTNTSVNLTFKLRVTKSATTSVGDFATFKLYVLRNASSTPQFINGIMVNNSAFMGDGTSWEGVFSQTLYASDIDISGSTFYGVYEISSDVHPNTCSYPLTKAALPSFSLSPTTLSIGCNEANAKTFTVTPANVPSGSTVTYQWNYGGWSLLSSSTNSITLTQSNGTSLPSNVSVTPYLNGVAKPTMTCTISRAGFSSLATLAGNTLICPGESSTYTINNPGTNTVSWSSSNTAIATVSNGTQGQVTVTGIADGAFDLIATITNPCGQSVTKIKNINVGAPSLTNGIIYGDLWMRKVSSVGVTFPPVFGAESYLWQITPSGDFPPVCPSTGVSPAKFGNGLQTMVTQTPSVTLSSGNCLGGYEIVCTIQNHCGNAVGYIRYLTVGNSGTSPCYNNSGTGFEKSFSISPNPVTNRSIVVKKIGSGSDISDIRINDPAPSIVNGDQPCFQDWPLPAPNIARAGQVIDTRPLSEVQVTVTVYDFMGKPHYTKTVGATDDIIIDGLDIQPGQYFIRISDGLNEQTEIINVE